MFFKRKNKLPISEFLEMIVGCIATKTVERIDSDLHHMMGYRISKANTSAYQYLESQGIELELQRKVTILFSVLIAKLLEIDLYKRFGNQSDLSTVLMKGYKYNYNDTVNDALVLNESIWREVGTHQDESFFKTDCSDKDCIYWKIPNRIFDLMSSQYGCPNYKTVWEQQTETAKTLIMQSIGIIVRETVKETQPILDNYKIV